MGAGGAAVVAPAVLDAADIGYGAAGPPLDAGAPPDAVGPAVGCAARLPGPGPGPVPVL